MSQTYNQCESAEIGRVSEGKSPFSGDSIMDAIAPPTEIPAPLDALAADSAASEQCRPDLTQRPTRLVRVEVVKTPVDMPNIRVEVVKTPV